MYFVCCLNEECNAVELLEEQAIEENLYLLNYCTVCGGWAVWYDVNPEYLFDLIQDEDSIA